MMKPLVPAEVSSPVNLYSMNAASFTMGRYSAVSSTWGRYWVGVVQHTGQGRLVSYSTLAQYRVGAVQYVGRATGLLWYRTCKRSRVGAM